MPARWSIPRTFHSVGLTYRLILYILVVAVVPVILIGLFAFRTGSQGIERHTELHLTSVVLVKAQEVERWFRPLEASALVLAGSPRVKEQIRVLLGGEGETEAKLAREALLIHLDDLVQRNIGLQQIAVISAGRELILASTAPNVAFAPVFMPLSESATAPLQVYLPPYIPGGNASPATIITPVLQEGQPLAYIVLLASPIPLYETVSPDAGLGPHGKVYLVNREGAILTPPQQLQLDSKTILAEGLITASANHVGSGLRYRDFLGTEVVGAYQPLEALGWGVAAEVPTAWAFRDIDRMRWSIVGISVTFLLLVLVAALFVSRRITRPLHTLMAGAEVVGSGNLDHRIEIQGRDEIGSLAQSFNRMATDLAATQTRLVEAERAAVSHAFEESLRESEERFRSVTESAIDGIIVADERGKIISLNQSAQRMFLYTEVELLRQPLTALMPERYRNSHERGLARLSLTNEPRIIGKTLELQGLRKDGTEFPLELSLTSWKTGEEAFYCGIMRDITERKRLEAQLVQSQKMEAVGRLAGGVAHDFNNLLTAIMGYSQLGLMALPQDQHTQSYLPEIQQAAQRAAGLTRQLLAFSRRQIIEPRVFNLNELITSLDKMLRRLIGEDIELLTRPAPDLGPVKVDPGQMEQVLMNLAVNSRDAMPDGGRLIIETANASLAEEQARQQAGISPGQYVMLSISDNGIGMSDEVKAHIFEPFFTTKELGKGTGLGLATCYGIVKQGGGYIEVSSQPGQGTTFRIYLPRIDETAEHLPTSEEPEFLPQGSETVLLVEDEALVRDLAARMLRSQGYRVLEAANGAEALRVAQEHPGGEIDLLLTDVVMPQMGGRELANRLRSGHPNIKVIFTSGYTDEVIVQQRVLEPGIEFLQKPFSPTTLALKIRAVLDNSQQPAILEGAAWPLLANGTLDGMAPS